jgi:hypothetical protein
VSRMLRIQFSRGDVWSISSSAAAAAAVVREQKVAGEARVNSGENGQGGEREREEGIRCEGWGEGGREGGREEGGRGGGTDELRKGRTDGGTQGVNGG